MWDSAADFEGGSDGGQGSGLSLCSTSRRIRDDQNPEDASDCGLFVHENVANIIVVSLEWVGHRVTTDRHTIVGYKSIKHMIPCRPVLPHVQLLHVHAEEQHQAIGI
jgi:hypothetical protein